MLNINLNNPLEVRTIGIQALREALGPVGAVVLCSSMIWDMGIIQKKRKMNRI